MLRDELRQFAEAGDHVVIFGRVKEVRRRAPGFVDVMLKACTVRKIEHRLPVNTHPEVSTDHLWLRLPAAGVEKVEAPDSCPTDMRHLYRRDGLKMMRKVRVVGRAGFYTGSQGTPRRCKASSCMFARVEPIAGPCCK
jgi:hypothetical protein